jgi:hypothetical protein
MHLILQQMGKTAFLGKDKILQSFWGYRLWGYFPPKFVFRGRHIFEAGVFEWWGKHLDFSLVLQTNVGRERIMSQYNQTAKTKMGGNKAAVAVLCLIPGVGLLISFAVFLFSEKCSEHDILPILRRLLSAVKKELQRTVNFVLKLDSSADNVSSINVHPKLESNVE